MCMDYCVNQNKGISGSVNSTLKSWTIDDQSQITVLKDIEVINDGFNCIKVRPDDKLFVTGGWDSRARVFSMKKLSPLAVLTYHRESVQCVNFSSQNILAVGSKDGGISMWNIYT